jgi:HSP20 family protein
MAKEGKGMAPGERARSGQFMGRGHRMMRPFEEVDRLINDYWPRSLMRGAFDAPVMQDMIGFDARLPRVDLMDKENAIVLHAELPGVDKKDVEISVSDDAVTIRASTREEKKEEDADYYHHEIVRGAFVRTIGLPVSVDADKAEAKFKDGMLELTLPKVQQSKRRQIPIQ